MHRWSPCGDAGACGGTPARRGAPSSEKIVEDPASAEDLVPDRGCRVTAGGPSSRESGSGLAARVPGGTAPGDRPPGQAGGEYAVPGTAKQGIVDRYLRHRKIDIHDRATGAPGCRCWPQGPGRLGRECSAEAGGTRVTSWPGHKPAWHKPAWHKPTATSSEAADSWGRDQGPRRIAVRHPPLQHPKPQANGRGEGARGLGAGEKRRGGALSSAD